MATPVNDLDAAYDARASVGDRFESFYMPEAQRVSAEVRASSASRLDLSYGSHRDEVCDVFLSREVGPLHIHLHGGYWRMGTKSEFSFVARALQPAGAAVVVPTYSLCPGVHLDVIVHQCRQAVAWTVRNAATLKADPDRLFLSGHSAGAHLVAMMLATDWESDYGLPVDVIKGATMVSGLYDLRPLISSAIGEWLQLSPSQAERNSPLLLPVLVRCPVILAVGGQEPIGFSRQQEAYRHMLDVADIPVSAIALPQLDHFAAWMQIVDAASPLTVAVLDQMGLGFGA